MSRNLLRCLQRPIVQTLRNSKPFVMVAVAAAGVVVGRGGGDNQRLHCPLLTRNSKFHGGKRRPYLPNVVCRGLANTAGQPGQ